MQGYIIRINPCRDEDLLVTILTRNHIQTSYRFYGARHSTINLGYKIDAELIHSTKSKLPQLRNILHLSHKWQHQRDKMLLWQNFIALFYEHLKGVEQIDEFYFTLLDEVAQKMHKQNPKRLQIEAYAKLLEHEGRLHLDQKCFLCEKDIKKDLTLARAYLPAHGECLHSSPIDPTKIKYFFTKKSTLLLDDELVDKLWDVMLEGF
ncbi:MAG: recombination protein RecO [Proteobacteria bacterium]|nr:MAG: recombination protein RecO [Pseudomonadota bacterium]